MRDRKQREAEEAMAYECRATRHWMARQAHAPSDWKPTWPYIGAAHVIHLECYRCGTQRHIAIDHTGGILASRYEWPDWYRRGGTEERLTGDELRLWQARQALHSRRKEKR